jgi:aspartyl-tRNA(Asn)/glutamyl-tRNA(Gln) amidotransferase subunit C
MSLSDDQVRRIAKLARVALRPEETGPAIERLNRVLALIDEMRAVDTTGIEPMAHALEEQLPQGQRLRADEVSETDRRQIFQSIAPAVEKGLYLVPKVIE